MNGKKWQAGAVVKPKNLIFKDDPEIYVYKF